jgi:NAD(P)-dependent dehydrogenase (short-subunit alcohol dehydrogenase family)
LSLSNKVALVSGTNTEIGAAIAEALGNEGATVLLTYYGEPGHAAGVAERLGAEGRQTALHAADLSQVAENQRLVESALERFGRLDIFVANAGLTVNAPFLETTENAWDTLVNLNLKGTYFGAQAAAKAMMSGGTGGRIVFSSSVTGVRTLPGSSAYGITKAALRHMASTLGSELGPHGITVNAVGIGATLNARNLEDDPDYSAHWAEVIPTGRAGTPEDVAQAVRFLVSNEAAMVNGHTLLIDGGWTNVGKVP